MKWKLGACIRSIRPTVLAPKYNKVSIYLQWSFVVPNPRHVRVSMHAEFRVSLEGQRELLSRFRMGMTGSSFWLIGFQVFSPSPPDPPKP